ncbi:MAG: S24 family peptidase [Bacteroidota bacterium]
MTINITDRIKQIFDYKGFTKYSEFAEATGLSHQVASNYIKGRQKPDPEKLAIIQQSFEEINAEWLLTGRGSMLKQKTEDMLSSSKPAEAIWVEYDRFKLVPLVSHRAQAGFLTGWGDEEYLDDLPKVPWEVDREYKGSYLTFEVSGDSMESDENPRESLFEGDLLLCREVQKQHWKNKLHINKWDFIIVHREQGILVKRILHHDTEKGALTLHSLNSYYDDFTVQLDDLIAVFNIVDVKRSRRR